MNIPVIVPPPVKPVCSKVNDEAEAGSDRPPHTKATAVSRRDVFLTTRFVVRAKFTGEEPCADDGRNCFVFIFVMLITAAVTGLTKWVLR